MFFKPKKPAPSLLDFASLGDAVKSSLAAPRWRRTKPGPRPSPWRDAMIAAIVEQEKQIRGGISERKACLILCDDPKYHELLLFLLPPWKPPAKGSDDKRQDRARINDSDPMLRARARIGQKGELVQLAQREHGDAWPAALIEQLLS